MLRSKAGVRSDRSQLETVKSKQIMDGRETIEGVLPLTLHLRLGELELGGGQG